MATCTTRTLEGMYIFSNPPKAVAAPVSLKQAGKLPNYKNYRNNTVANNFRSIYSPNHFISGRPLSGYWWREKKETFEQRVSATPVNPVRNEDGRKHEKTVTENISQDASCQTHETSHDDVESTRQFVHSYCQTTPNEYEMNTTPDADVSPSESPKYQILSQQLLAQAEETVQENETFSLEVVSRVLSRTYIEDMIPNICHRFKENGCVYEHNGAAHESESVLPWLMSELELGLSRLEASYELLNQKTTR